ncbi:MAG: serine hydrolase domain-containing protein [Deefgea sp.]
MHSVDCPAIKPAAMINQAQLQTKVDQFRRSNDLPGLGVALVQNDEIHCAGSGQQRIDSAALIQSNETFQLGALNKALTATLVARWVEQGKLRWDSTLADLLPAWREQMCTEYQTVTLLQLLQHRAGLPRDLSDMNYPNLLAILGGNTFADRSTAVRWILQQAHVSQINQTSRYSNLGYMIAAIIIEFIGNNTYENILQQHLLQSLNIHAQFTNTTPVQGHRYIAKNWFSKQWQIAQASSEDQHRLANLDPASRLSLSLSDYAVFLRAHLRRLRAPSTRLNQASPQTRHTPLDHDLGWSIIHSDQLGPISVHDSAENGRTNYTIIIPSQNRAVAVMCNGESARSGAKLVRFAESLVI